MPEYGKSNHRKFLSMFGTVQEKKSPLIDTQEIDFSLYVVIKFEELLEYHYSPGLQAFAVKFQFYEVNSRIPSLYR